MAMTPDRDSLFTEAVTHAIRLQANPQSPEALEALAGWRRSSPLHEQAWREIVEIHGMTGTLLAPPPHEAGVSRRKILGLGLAGLGVAAGAGLFGPGLVLAARADHLTSTGQILDLALPDGSRLSLGPDSAVAMDFAAGRRHLTLLAGMAYCKISGDAPAPFRLSCHGTGLVSHAAALNISEEAGGLSLAIDHGDIRIESGPQADATLTARDWMALDPAGGVKRGRALATADASAWRQGLIVTEAERLSAVVARIARWLPGRVVIADPGLGARLVSGVFDMGRPREALLAAVSPHGAGLRQISPWLTVVTAL